MDPIQEVTRLNDSGHFREALTCLDALSPDVRVRPSVQILRAELLDRIGHLRDADTIIRRALGSRNLTASDRSRAEFVMARIAIEQGRHDDAVAHLHKSASHASRADDFERLCYAQLKLLLVLSDGAGTDAAAPLLAEARMSASKSGNGRVLASLHVYIAQIEALRASTKTARRHLALARQLLRETRSIWLDSMIENIELALCLMNCEFERAKIHAEAGAQLASRTGAVVEYAVNQGNSGYLWQVLGLFDRAAECYERTLSELVPGTERFDGALDSLAQTRLAQGRLEECEELLERIAQGAALATDRDTYVGRHVHLTKAQLLFQRGDSSQSLQHLDAAIRMADRAGDRRLRTMALLHKGEVLISADRRSEAIDVIANISADLPEQAPDIWAQFEAFLAHAVATDELNAAQTHWRHAEQTYKVLGHRQGLIQIANTRKQLETDTESVGEHPSVAILSRAVAALCNPQYPDLLAMELVEILGATGLVAEAVAVRHQPNGEDNVISEVHKTDMARSATTLETRMVVGQVNGATVELIVHPYDGAESRAGVETVLMLLTKALELRAFREERDARSTVWPRSETATYDQHGVISGHMRELMTFAQRVARTTVNVLITGESGTGKEILARAIHHFSDRAQKPFVPLNCAAVPRELLESQLFGHRRGAFTGADRDYLGLVRSAADGTLFLDEIGEMSLDLQPKLLRFLESGEIAPLGDAAPSTVDVRVIAATNANLEDAVRDGRFREDLFYRLNVVRLSIRPLRERRDEIPGMVTHFVAAAARDYKKGRLEVAEDTLERLLLYRWPGNVRQLQNEIRRMVALADPNSTLGPDAISPDIIGALPNFHKPIVNGREIAVPLHDKLLPTLSRIEYEMIKAALRDNHGKVDPAARALGISRKGLYLKRQRLGL